jgi:hypothetical protein
MGLGAALDEAAEIGKSEHLAYGLCTPLDCYDPARPATNLAYANSPSDQSSFRLQWEA